MFFVYQLKEKIDQSHISQQQALSLKKLEEARQDKIKKLVYVHSVSANELFIGFSKAHRISF